MWLGELLKKMRNHCGRYSNKQLRLRILKERIKLVPDYGVIHFISQENKNKICLFLLNILIWGTVISTLESLIEPRIVTIEVAHADATMVTAGVEVKQPGVSVIETNGTVSEEPQSSSSQPDIEKMIREAFPNDAENMLYIANAESRMKADAININSNGSKDCGLFQVNSIHGYDCEWLKDPKNNIEAAKVVYSKQGKKAWVTWNWAVAHNEPKITLN